MSESIGTIPQWDLTVLYSGPAAPQLAQDMRQLGDDIAALTRLFDDHHVAAQPAVKLDGALVASFEAVLSGLNALFDRAETIQAYLYGLVSTDSRDAAAQARLSEFQQLDVQMTQLQTRFVAWAGSLDVEGLIGASALAADHAYALRRARERAQHLMSPSEEALAAEMGVSGGQGWQKLWGDVSSQIVVSFELDGKPVDLPMPALRNLARHPDRDVRRRAYEAELAAWQRNAVPLAAAMNGIKGQVNLLARRRGWQSALDEALFANGIDRPTLETMMGTAQEYFPVFRRYLQAKARALGAGALPWYDLFAPLGQSTSRWQFGTARRLIIAQFGGFSARLSEMARRAFDERWIDAEPRSGKRDGAYCMPLRAHLGESRVFANYGENLNSVTTLAHELGHAYHNVNLAGRTATQRDLPMVLAETASTFCESVVRMGALQQADRNEQIAILDDALTMATGVVVDIASRFQLEHGVFEQRAQRILSIDELNSLMLQAQKDTYGDGLDAEILHPYMWAAKPHYYRPELSFYNFPYMFGLLFGLGLYARYQAEPQTFIASYDDLLSATGMADPATLAGRFGIDVRTPAFWRASLDVISRDVERLVALLG